MLDTKLAAMLEAAPMYRIHKEEDLRAIPSQR